MASISPGPVVIAGTGLYAPPGVVTNEELCVAFNAYVDAFNREHAAAIARGEVQALEHSSAEFIVKASGIERRHAVDRNGILDPAIMAPRIPERRNEERSLQCEMALTAATQAFETAGVDGKSVDCVIVACSNLQRPYPAIAVEVQNALGASGFGFDMNVACSSATFGIAMARDLVLQGSARRVLVVNPEICTAHLNFRDRENHFIFGDACTASIIERLEETKSREPYAILSTRLATHFSNNIRNNYGFLGKTAPEHRDDVDKLFMQQGRKVFKEVSPLVAELLISHLDEAKVPRQSVRRLWLHQANLTMNQWIARKVLGREPAEDEAPSMLSEYANTSSAGSIIAFHENREGLQKGDVGVICSFGAGYSIGSVIVRKET